MAEQEYDYAKLGLKCGIEIHQQLESKQKLFCRCSNRLEGHVLPIILYLELIDLF